MAPEDMGERIPTGPTGPRRRIDFKDLSPDDLVAPHGFFIDPDRGTQL